MMNEGAKAPAEPVRILLVALRGQVNRRRAFTLVELLLVIGIIGLLAALLMTGLSQAKKRTQSTVCVNHLHQIGLSMQMYVSDHNIYPSTLGGGGPPFKTWADQLASYNPLYWTNLSWHCPVYIAEGGSVVWKQPPPGGGGFKVASSYAYNGLGMIGFSTNGAALARKGAWLGLGDLSQTVPQNKIVAPAEQFAIADTRPLQYAGVRGMEGSVEMHPWQLIPAGLNPKNAEAKPPHADAYNMLFVDGHVHPVKRRDYLYPPRAAQNWNRDHQPHPELWSAASEWVVQN